MKQGGSPMTGIRLRPLVRAYRALAYVTGVLIIVLCFAGIPLQVAGHPALVKYVGQVHGFLYIIYVIVAFLLAVKLRMGPVRSVILMLAGTIPVMTFVVERWTTRRFINPAFAAEAEQASGTTPRAPARS
jgi:integral membrane protein